MSAWSVGEAAQGVTAVLRRAATATGAGFDYLLSTATRESGVNPKAQARTSSAAGMFQFVEQTWLEMVAKNGSEHGLSREAAMIDRTAAGRYVVRDPSARADILSLRFDAEVSAKMAGEFTQQNAAQLSGALGRQPSQGELYIAHFLGAQGATDLIKLAERSPDASAAAAFPDAAAANRSIFYSGGEARSAQAVYDRLTAGHRVDAAAAQFAVRSSKPAEAEGEAALMAYAEQGPVFHSMFHSGRRTPVSAYVQSVWENLPPATATATVATAANTAPPVQTAKQDAPLPVARPTRSPLAGRLGDATSPLDLVRFLKADVIATPKTDGVRA